MNRVVIIGLGTISPAGNSVPEFWNHIVHGEIGIGTDYPV